MTAKYVYDDDAHTGALKTLAEQIAAIIIEDEYHPEDYEVAIADTVHDMMSDLTQMAEDLVKEM